MFVSHPPFPWRSIVIFLRNGFSDVKAAVSYSRVPGCRQKKGSKSNTKNHLLEGLPVPKSIEEFRSESYKEIWFSKERDLDLILGAKTAGAGSRCRLGFGDSAVARQTKTVRSYKGVEAGRVPVEFARNVLGIDVFCGQLEDANFGEREFDIVAMIHALEHVPHPRQMVRKIYRLLKDDGVLIVVVPSLQSSVREGRSQSERGFSPNTTIHISRRKPLPGSLIERVCVPMVTSEEGRYNHTCPYSMDPSIFGPFLPKCGRSKSFLELEKGAAQTVSGSQTAETDSHSLIDTTITNASLKKPSSAFWNRIFRERRWKFSSWTMVRLTVPRNRSEVRAAGSFVAKNKRRAGIRLQRGHSGGTRRNCCLSRRRRLVGERKNECRRGLSRRPAACRSCRTWHLRVRF